MKIYYNIILFFIFITSPIFSQDFGADLKILPPNPSIVRFDNVIAGTAYIRFKYIPNDSIEIQSVLNRLPIKNVHIIGRLLKPEQSIYFNSELKKKLKPQSKINKILSAEEPLLRTFIVNFDNNIIPEYFCKKIAKECSDIDIAEPYYVSLPTGEFKPNDTLLDKEAYLIPIKAFEAWSIFRGDSNIVIGVPDTGVMQDHEDLAPSIWLNTKEIPNNGIDDDGNGYIDDYNGYNFTYKIDTTAPGNTTNLTQWHGTLTAGVAGAKTNNITGVASPSFGCKIFPFKTMPNYQGGIIFGYQAIIYSALMGFDVVNCSWGGSTYSCINQSIIDYAVSRNLAVVAAAGNGGTSSPFYPAAYIGVLGVGVTDATDLVLDMSPHGFFVDILTPGGSTYSTFGDGTYAAFCCTSGAAPIAAAAVALARSKYPALNAIQAIEFTRRCADDITNVNPTKADIIPGRLDLLKVVTINPDSISSIKPININFENTNYVISKKFIAGDTVNLLLDLINYLGDAGKTKLSMSVIRDTNRVITLLDSINNLEILKAGEIAANIPFKFIVNKKSNIEIELRIDVEIENQDKDFFIIPFTPYSNYNNFSNDSIYFSAADNGRLGFSNSPSNTLGSGFKYKSGCSLLFEGGLIATENMNRVVSEVRNIDTLPQCDFKIVKEYIEPDINTSIVNDSLAPDFKRIGLEISTTISFPLKNKPCTRLDITTKNISGNILNNVSIGHYLDWDIGTYGDSNYAEMTPNLIPVKYGENAAACYITRFGNEPCIGLMVLSEDSTAKAQLAILLNRITYQNYFSDSEKIAAFNSGTKNIYDKPDDIGAAVGMNFPAEFQPDSVKKYSLCMCAASDSESIKNYLREIGENAATEINNLENTSKIKIEPQPANNLIKIELPNNFTPINSVRILDLYGRNISTFNFDFNNRENKYLIINTENFSSGVYLLNFLTNSKNITLPIIVIH